MVPNYSKSGFSLGMEVNPTTKLANFYSKNQKPRTISSGSSFERGCLQSKMATLFPIQAFPCDKTRWIPQTHPGSLPTEPVSCGSIFQNGQPQYSTKYFAPRFFSCLLGHQGCVSSCPHTSQPSQVPSFHGGTRPFFLESSSLRPSCGSSGFYKTNEISPGQTKRTKDFSTGLLRRLDYLGTINSRIKSCHSLNMQFSSKSGIPHQLEKVRSDPKTISQVAWCHLGHRALCGKTTHSLCHRISTIGCRSPQKKEFLKANLGKTYRKSSLYVSSATSSKATFLSYCQSEPLSCSSPRCPYTHTSTPSNVFEGLGKCGHCSSKLSDKASSTFFDNMDRCFNKRVGSFDFKTISSTGLVEFQRNSTAYKLSGNLGNRKGSCFFPKCDFSANKNRQLGCNPSHSQRRLKITCSSRCSLLSPQNSQRSKYFSACVSCTRKFERGSRLPFQNTTIANRMVTSTSRISETGLPFWITANRFIRLPTQLQSGAFCNSFSSSQSISNRCFQSELVKLAISLPFSTNKSVTKGNSETVKFQRKSLDNFSLASSCPLVPLPAISLQALSSSTDTRAGSARPPHKRNIDLLRTLGRMAFLRAMFRMKYSSRVTELLLSAHRPSTQKQNEVAWRAFKNWLPNSIIEIDKALVLEYLAFLFWDKKLSPRTIMSYRAALALPLQLGFSINTADKEFSLEAKGSFIRKPPAPRLVPSWSISEALKALKLNDILNLTMSKKMFYKALFLTALASGSRVSELAALDRAQILISPIKIVLPVRQGFIYKNQSLAKCPEAIAVPRLVEDPLLCPVAALNNYLHSTKHLNHGNHVFLSPISGKPLNAARLGFWLANIISKLLPNSRPRAHDVRKYAFSLAWAKGITMKEIIDRGFWSSSNTFIKKYLVPTSSDVACVAAQQLLA